MKWGESMNRNEQLCTIFDQFDRCAKAFCDRTDGFSCDISSTYKGGEEAQDLKSRFAKIYYPSFALEFHYIAHGMLNVTNSILSCTVYLDKTEEAVGIPLPLFTDYCDYDTEVPLCIPSISNELGMRQAFDCISSVLESILPEIAHISVDADRRSAVMTAFREEVKHIFDLKDEMFDAMNINAVCSDFFAERFTSTAFLNHIKGKDAKAVKQLSKIKRLTGYEKRMIRVWEGCDRNSFPDLSSIVSNAELYNDSGVQKNSFKEFVSLFLAWFALTPLVSVPYLGIFFLVYFIENRNSVYLMGAIYNFPFCILAGFLTALVVSYFTRFKVYKLLFKKDYDKFCELDHIQNSAGADKLMKEFLAVIVAGCLACSVLFAKWNLNFLADGFYDNTDFFSANGTFYSYDEVQRVYYKPNRVNGFGETLEFPSYVLVLKNGEEIDFYEYDDIDEYEDTLLEHLRKQGVLIER